MAHKNYNVAVDCSDALHEYNILPEIIIDRVEKFFGCQYWQLASNWEYRENSFLFMPDTSRPRIVASNSMNSGVNGKDHIDKVIDWLDIDNYRERTKEETEAMQKIFSESSEFNASLL